MKLHYMGKFNLDPDSLPQAEHKPGAVEFKEADSMKKLSIIANTVACIILVILGAAAFFRIVPVAEPKSATITWFAALLGSILIIFPHELLHAILIFGIVPYVIGMIFPKFIFMTMFGMICTSMGAGDYYNVFNAIRQVPKNGRVYMSGMRSYWYVEE